VPQNLKSFLSELAVEPEKLAHYLKHPGEAMKEAGLNAEECSALTGRDAAKLYAILSGHKPPAPTVCIVLPGPPTICAVRPAASNGDGQSCETVCIVQAQPYAIHLYALPPQPTPKKKPKRKSKKSKG
jgi:hypothetical protein